MTRAGLKATTLRQCRAAIVYRYATDPALYGLDDPTKTDRAKAEMSAESANVTGPAESRKRWR